MWPRQAKSLNIHNNSCWKTTHSATIGSCDSAEGTGLMIALCSWGHHNVPVMWLQFILGSHLIVTLLHFLLVMWSLLITFYNLQTSVPSSNKQTQWKSQQDVTNSDHMTSQDLSNSGNWDCHSCHLSQCSHMALLFTTLLLSNEVANPIYHY